MADVDLVLESDSIKSIPFFTIDNPDLVVKDGDLAFVGGDEQIKNSIIRKLKAEAGSYELLIQTYADSTPTSNTVVLRYGSTYGSNLGSVRSEPVNSTTINKIKQIVVSTIESDGRITIQDTPQVSFVPANGSIKIDINYTINDTSISQQVSVEI